MRNLRLVPALLATTTFAAMQLAATQSQAQSAPTIVAQAKEEEKAKQPPKAPPPPARPTPPAPPPPHQAPPPPPPPPHQAPPPPPPPHQAPPPPPPPHQAPPPGLVAGGRRGRDRDRAVPRGGHLPALRSARQCLDTLDVHPPRAGASGAGLGRLAGGRSTRELGLAKQRLMRPRRPDGQDVKRQGHQQQVPETQERGE